VTQQLEVKVIGLEIGQVVKTDVRTIAVPEWHEVFNPDSGNFKMVGNTPAIRLLGEGENCIINTDRKQSGLVCWVPEKCLGCAVLSVRITRVNTKSVVAEPVEWIESDFKLGYSDIGKDAEFIYNRLVSMGYKADWHSKESV
jgi:hypothetical protein